MSAEPTLFPMLLPTVEGKVQGIVSLDPFTLQCHDCGSTYADGRRPGWTVTLSRYRFHVCEGREGVRRCPDCLTAAKKACPNSRCSR